MSGNQVAPRQAQQQNRANGKPDYKKQEPEFNVPAERASFLAHVRDPGNRAEYARMLGPDIDVDRFLAVAIDTVEQRPELLNPVFRSSLFFSLKKAAKQGLKPDGKEGALIPRWDNDARMKVVQWQPMVWGVVRAGRRAKAISKIVAELIFVGEPFRFLKGDEERIEHEWQPDIRSAAYAMLRPQPNDGYSDDAPGINIAGFWDRVAGCYCIVTAPDGSKIRRAMPRERLLNLRDFSKAKGGPWQSVWVDEMILKAGILFTMKHVETDNVDEKMRAFREAMEQDMDVDLDGDGRTIDHEPPKPASAPVAALAAPVPNAMDRLSQQINGQAPQREKVEVNQQQEQQQPRQQEQQQTKAEPKQEARKEPEAKQQPQDKPAAAAAAAAPASQPSGAEAAAERFANDIKRDIEALAMTTEGTVSGLFSNQAVATKFGRIQGGYPKIYKKVVELCASEPIRIRLGDLQSINEKFYDDVMAEILAAKQEDAA